MSQQNSYGSGHILYDMGAIYRESIALNEDREMRKLMAQERSAEREREASRPGRKSHVAGKKAVSAGKNYADNQTRSIAAHDKATKGKHTIGNPFPEEYQPSEKVEEALDPVGQEDSDVDNDGDSDKSDKYLLKRRKAIGKAISKRKVKESFSDWRHDLREIIKVDTETAKDSEIKGLPAGKKNKIIINPPMKEAIENLGGELIEMVEIEEESYMDYAKRKAAEKKDTRMTVTAADKKGNTTAYQRYKAGDSRYKAGAGVNESSSFEVDEGYQPIGREKETAMYRRAGNLARTSLSSRGKKKEEAQKKSSNIVSAITRQKEKERFDRIGQSPAHNEEFQLDEKTLTAAETKKKEEIVKSMKKNLAGFRQRYGERAKEVMYATATKQAKKVAEGVADQNPLSPQELKSKSKKANIDTQIAQLRKQSLAKMKNANVTTEEVEQIDERRREDKGTPRGPEPSAAFKTVSKLMGASRMGVKPRGVKKEKGAPTPGPSITPAQKVAKRRAAAQHAQDMMHSPRD